MHLQIYNIADTPLKIRRVRGARNYTISYNPAKCEALLTLPMRASMKEALKFAQSRQAWLEKTKACYPERQKFYPGVTLNVMDEHITFLHVPGRGLPLREGGRVVVRGDIQFFHRRVRDWLNAELKRVLREEVDACAVQLEYHKPIPIQVKAMNSLWGRCSHDGSLAFSSRLALAPRQVVRYLAAHECAHLRHHDHSPRFWALVAKLDPHHAASRAWLRKHGAALSQFG